MPPTTLQTLSTSPGNGDYFSDPTPTFIWDEGDTSSQTAWVDWSSTAATYLTTTNDGNPPETYGWVISQGTELRYDLQVAALETGWNSPVVDVTELTEPTYTASLPDGQYMWRVRAMDCTGNISEWSHTSPYRRFTIDTTAPDAPNLVSPADYYITNDITPTFTWEQVVDSRSYHSSELSGNFVNSDYCDTVCYLIQIEIAGSLNNGDGTGDVFNQTIEYSNDPRDPHDVYHPEMFQAGDGRMSFTPTILPNIGAGKTFFWRVTAIDCAENESTWSEIRALRIDSHIPACPTLVSPDDGTYTNDPTPFFDWSDEGPSRPGGSAYQNEGTGPGIDKITYQIQVDNNIDFSNPEVDEWVNVSSCVPPVPLRDGTYYWRVGGVDEAGNRCADTGWSTDVREIHINTQTGPDCLSCRSVSRLIIPADGQCLNDAAPIFDWDPIGDPSAPIVYTFYH